MWKTLESQCYRAIRAAVRDFKRMLPKTMLDVILKRAPPRMWSHSISASTGISLYNNSDTRFAKQLRASSYINDIRPRRAKFSDTSKKENWKTSFGKQTDAS